MVRAAWSTIVRSPAGEEITVVKLSRGIVANRWNAQRVINAVRASGPLSRMALDVVVMDGEPADEPRVMGSCAGAEDFVRRVGHELADYPWHLLKLDW